MKPIEIIVIIVAVFIVISVIARAIYKKVKNVPSCECQSCQNRMINALKKFKYDQDDK